MFWQPLCGDCMSCEYSQFIQLTNVMTSSSAVDHIVHSFGVQKRSTFRAECIQLRKSVHCFKFYRTSFMHFLAIGLEIFKMGYIISGQLSTAFGVSWPIYEDSSTRPSESPSVAQIVSFWYMKLAHWPVRMGCSSFEEMRNNNKHGNLQFQHIGGLAPEAIAMI